MMPAFAPQPGSVGARAIAYLQSRGGDEASSVEMASALGIPIAAVGAYLGATMRHGLIVRDRRGGKSYWRLGGASPPPDPGKNTDSDDDSDDDAASIARDLPAFATGPLAGMVRQSWCPAAQETGSESSLDEPPAPPPRPAATPIGLGWKSPRVPVFLADAPTPAIAIEPGEDPELRALEDLHDQAVRRATAPAATADAVQALSAAIAPTPPDDPDFQEVRRDLGLVLSSVIPEHVQTVLGEVYPDNHPKGAEAACAPTAPCGRDIATPKNGGVPQGPGEGFRCALWSNGRLDMLTTEGERILLNADDTRGLLRYVGDTLSARARAAA